VPVPCGRLACRRPRFQSNDAHRVFVHPGKNPVRL